MVGWLLGVGSSCVLGYLGLVHGHQGRQGRARAADAGARPDRRLGRVLARSSNRPARRSTCSPSATSTCTSTAASGSMKPGPGAVLQRRLHPDPRRRSCRRSGPGSAGAGRDPNPVAKFGLGLLQVGASFFVLVWGASSPSADFRVPLIFLAAGLPAADHGRAVPLAGRACRR